MIRFSLCCRRSHKFEGWFAGNEDYEKQQAAGLIACPVCGSARVSKTLMMPNLMTKNAKQSEIKVEGARERQAGSASAAAAGGREEALQKLLVLQKMQKRKLEVLHKLQNLARKMRENAENVGDKFAEEARKIHFGESEKRSVYGTAKAEDIRALREDGVDVAALPRLPEDNH